MNLKIIFFGLFVLGACVAVQFSPERVGYFCKLDSPLAEILPAAGGGWTYEDVPIASTPDLQEAVEELLNFTEGIYRVYKKGALEIKVYVAYWDPGKMDPRLVGVHSPDVCWVAAGWSPLGSPSRLSLRGKTTEGLKMGHFRRFRIGAHDEEVVFWHLVGGENSVYLESTTLRGRLFGFFRHPFSPSAEQFFIRISSRNLGEVCDDTFFRSILDALSVTQKARISVR